jgi:hypothetical protein
MRSEDETELIERQHREKVAPPKEWKNALRDLGYNKIIFEHRQAIVANAAKTQILRDVVQSLTRNRIVNVIEGATCPAPWP